ncbi:MAG: hypothetical protein DRQ59_02550 [Gammaproteobacteria bacterium]|nr:MAG: hypothetical protein DRQ59_02550 [Gammaproteobacteria bacterium]
MQDQGPYQLIDLDRYPLNNLDSEAGQQLIADTQVSLGTTGACSLPGFVRASAISEMAAQASSLEHLIRCIE